MIRRPDLAIAHQILGVMRPPDGGSDSIEALRWRYEAMCAPFRPTPSVVVSWLQEPVEGSALVKSDRDQEPEHCILFFHGGGGVFGSPYGYLGWAERLARTTGAAVLIVRYRLAPEDPFPANMDDAATAWSWLRDQGFADGHIALYGDSAGGATALAMALRIRDELDERPAAVVAVSAVTERIGFGDSFVRNASVDAVVSKAGAARTRALYLNGADPSHPWASPLFADLQHLPSVLLQVGANECLLDDSTRFTAEAQKQGVDVELVVVDEMFHAFPMFDFLPESQEAIEHAARFLDTQW